MAKVDELLAKHPHLTEEEAKKIIADKNARKNKRRADKVERNLAKKQKRDAND